MPIVNLQRRIAEVGRIRAGQKGERGQPEKLDTWRLTSPHKGLVVAAAEIYGGTPEEWQSPAGPQWEVVTDADALNVIIPPAEMSFSQFYELWSGGGCQRRCDGVRELLGDQPCVCDPDARDCRPTSRLSLILPELPGFGVWRVESHGWHAASELAAAVELIQHVQSRGLVPAELRLVERQVRRPGEPTKRFKVVTLDARLSAAQLMAATDTPVLAAPATGELAEAFRPELEAGFTPAGLDTSEPPPVAEQVAVKPKTRTSTKEKVPPTGRAPRTAQQAGDTATRPATDAQKSAIRKLTKDDPFPDDQLAGLTYDAAVSLLLKLQSEGKK